MELVANQQTGNAALLYNDSLTLIIDKQSIYVAMLVNLALFSIAQLVRTGSVTVTQRGWVYAAVFILLVANFVLASRIAIALLYGSICCLCSIVSSGGKNTWRSPFLQSVLQVQGSFWRPFFRKQ